MFFSLCRLKLDRIFFFFSLFQGDVKQYYAILFNSAIYICWEPCHRHQVIASDIRLLYIIMCIIMFNSIFISSITLRSKWPSSKQCDITRYYSHTRHAAKCYVAIIEAKIGQKSLRNERLCLSLLWSWSNTFILLKERNMLRLICWSNARWQYFSIRSSYFEIPSRCDSAWTHCCGVPARMSLPALVGGCYPHPMHCTFTCVLGWYSWYNLLEEI